MARLQCVTGALGYSGQQIARLLLDRGDRVRTLTNSPRRPNPFGDRLEIYPLSFEKPESLVGSLEGVDTLFNTYWVRFNHKRFTFNEAAANTRRLFAAAKQAGVRRIVHVSILKPEQGRGLAYYDGKQELEKALRELDISHAILRPGVLFGRGDILVNNIAWTLRHLPVFGVFGRGDYKVQPMHVDDFAALATECADRENDFTADAVGPETFEFRELVRTIAEIIGVRRPIVSIRPGLGYAISRLINPLVGDVIITREEIEGLMRGLLFSDSPRTGGTRLTEWAQENRDRLGRRYASEVGRRIRRDVSYSQV
ncbi:MAG: NAD(P)H-binding protein [Phycisphaeraceae bacterium]|nr:NAD(P)H-binding protein [Phycisphaeraceae bacterium]